jgi:hypothetical protein
LRERIHAQRPAPTATPGGWQTRKTVNPPPGPRASQSPPAKGRDLSLVPTLASQSAVSETAQLGLGGLDRQAMAKGGTPMIVAGQPAGEALGDFGRPIGSFFGNVVGTLAGAFGGGSVSTDDALAPVWNDHGKFDWYVGFRTSGRNGWLVQEINADYRVQNAAGVAVPVPYTPKYWEAWRVDAAGAVTPNIGAVNDTYIRPDMDIFFRSPHTQGHWSIRGYVYFTNTDPATQGFVTGQVRDAGTMLMSTTSQPQGLGVARLHRYAQGHWETTGAHTGSAG